MLACVSIRRGGFSHRPGDRRRPSEQWKCFRSPHHVARKPKSKWYLTLPLMVVLARVNRRGWYLHVPVLDRAKASVITHSRAAADNRLLLANDSCRALYLVIKIVVCSVLANAMAIFPGQEP